jgi:DNA-binding response OmpR family regulator
MQDETQQQSQPEQPEQSEQHSDTSSTPPIKKKILLVEDDEALAAVYRSRLELEDFEIYEVNNGEQALQAAKEFKPDLILLDAMMPKISGFDVLDILRHTPETANIRVIMLTALSQPKDKERAEALGVDDYMVKSQVVIGDVVDRVRHHLGMTTE